MDSIKNFNNFYQFYLSEHSNKVCRLFHFIGTSFVFIFLFMALYYERALFWFLVPISGYGFAWIGHLLFEKNKPATFKYPFWSLISDFKMYFQILSGKIGLDNSKDDNVI